MTNNGGESDGVTALSDGSGSPEPSFSVDDLLDLFADRHRRALLEYLSDEADPTTSLDDAVSFVTNRVAEETGRRPNEDDVEIRLQHHHLPRLVESNVVEYDTRSGTIRYYENEQLERFHEHIREFGDQ